MKVLITDPITDGGKSLLSNAGIEIIDLTGENSKILEKYLPQIDGWIIRSGTKITENHIQQARNLKVIGRAGVGIDNIDINSVTLHGIVVMNTPDANTISAAEHTIAMILSLARNVHMGYDSLRKGLWERNRLIGTELHGKTLGVVGLGKIGTEVIRRLQYFGLNFIGYDPYVSQEHYEFDFVKIGSLETLCEKSDIITIHVPKTSSTNGMFDMKILETMKDTALIINCARGGIIVEEDLKKALENNTIAGAALDVFETEPPENSPLLKAPNLLFTPHLAASTKEAKEGVSISICTQVRDYLIDGKLSNALNFPIVDPSLLVTLEPFLRMTEILGSIQQQLADSPAQIISVTTEGSLKETKLITLAFLKGYLEKIHGSTVNYINAIAVAGSHGMRINETYEYGESDYANVISTTVSCSNSSLTIKASLFGDVHPRIIYFDGFHLDLKPAGNLLIIYNKDVPGVVGKVGTHLGNHGINIAEYQLSREPGNHHAISIIRTDSPLNEGALQELIQINDILSAKQVVIE
ncbi:MAG: phosphoglycerate dehydrogenase [Candidatus Marinimicrobia bacterium]|nr:phosphoglycerate dehydrogenase [Candidatus Neomarinimicrobiota bacterium]